MEPTDDFVKRLPPELVRASLNFLSRSDLKNVRLVNKNWNTVAASLLWAHLEIDLIDTESRKLDGLIYPYPEAVFGNTSSLKITTRDAKVKRRSQSIANLTGLLGALPRDCLTAFCSCSFRLDRNLLALLLRTQTQMSLLEFCSGKKDQDGLPGSMHVRGNLEKLQDLCICIVGENRNTYEGLKDWFQHTPSLLYLRILGRLNTPNLFRGWSLPADPPLLKLRLLSLCNVELLPSTNTIATMLDLPFLERLEFEDCVSGEHMIRSLARQYAKADHCSLRHLSYTANKVDSATCKAFEELLQSVDKATDITLGAVEDSLLDLGSLQRTGKSIKFIDIYAFNEDRFYSASELELLNVNCPNLDTLQLDLANLAAVVAGQRPEEPCDLSSFGTLEESLTVLAQHPALKTLTLTGYPLLANCRDSDVRQWCYARLAEQIMRYLSKHGSKICELGFEPSPMDLAAGTEDDDGHTWPYYRFRKGTVTVEIQGKAKVKTVVVPYGEPEGGRDWSDQCS